MEYVSISTPPGEYNLTHKDPKRRKFATYLFYLQEWVYNFADGCDIYYCGFIHLYSFVETVWSVSKDPFYVDSHSEIADGIVKYKFNYLHTFGELDCGCSTNGWPFEGLYYIGLSIYVPMTLTIYSKFKKRIAN